MEEENSWRLKASLEDTNTSGKISCNFKELRIWGCAGLCWVVRFKTWKKLAAGWVGGSKQATAADVIYKLMMMILLPAGGKRKY
jgi:hypothetical protein